MPNPPPKEDSWHWSKIGLPFCDNPVKVLGQQNMYVALWYKNGKPCHGRAYNENGNIECSFPYALLKVELTEHRDLGGEIQILQYKGDHRSLGYWYNWIKYSERPTDAQKASRELVHCGDSSPIFWQNRKEGPLLGYLDAATETAWFGLGGKAVSVKGDDLKDMLIIIRELKGGPPTCGCDECKKVPPPIGKRVMLNEWADIRSGDPWPQIQLVRALNRSLNTLPNENPDQYVALWYQAGEPVMGRVWNDGGKIAANFSWNSRVFSSNVGSIQILVDLPEHVRGFDYDWKPFQEAAQYGAKEWHPVHVDNHKFDISPAVMIVDGKEILGKVDVRNERATVGYKGEEKVFVGPAVHSCKVLCRKAKPGCKFD